MCVNGVQEVDRYPGLLQTKIWHAVTAVWWMYATVYELHIGAECREVREI